MVLYNIGRIFLACLGYGRPVYHYEQWSQRTEATRKQEREPKNGKKNIEDIAPTLPSPLRGGGSG